MLYLASVSGLVIADEPKHCGVVCKLDYEISGKDGLTVIRVECVE